MIRPQKSIPKYAYVVAAAIGMLIFLFGNALGYSMKHGGLGSLLSHPDRFKWFPKFTPMGLMFAIFFTVLYGVGLIIFYDKINKQRREKESGGSGRFADNQKLHNKYATKGKPLSSVDIAAAETGESPENTALALANKKVPEYHIYTDKIFSKDIVMSPDNRKTRHTLNTLVVGGTGKGKSRFLAKPNLLQGNFSYVVLDPKGELLRETGYAMKTMGYKVKVLNLKDMDQSDCYNPFFYLRDDNDIQTLVTNFFKSTGVEGGGKEDPFWDNAAKALLTALISYCFYVLEPEEQNFGKVGELLRLAAVKDETAGWKSTLDYMFDDLTDPESPTYLEPGSPGLICVKFYQDYHSGAAKTLQSIQITLAARLNKFNLASLQRITSSDSLELPRLGQEKTVLYCVIPFDDDSYNFLVSILYTQLFQQLFRTADKYYKGFLPVHVDLMMDEFHNVAVPDSFAKIVSVIRSYNISVTIILQDISQIETDLEKEYKSVIANCDEFLYLGGNAKDTHKYISELIGDQTIFTNSTSVSRGKNGQYSRTEQESSRAILKPEEVRLLNEDGDYCLVFVSDEKPVFDLKYDVTNHPNYHLLPEGGGQEYYHNELVLNESNSLSQDDVAEIYENTDTASFGSNLQVYSSEELMALYLEPVDSGFSKTDSVTKASVPA